MLLYFLLIFLMPERKKIRVSRMGHHIYVSISSFKIKICTTFLPLLYNLLNKLHHDLP